MLSSLLKDLLYKKIILGSGSHSRKLILDSWGVDYVVKISSFEENLEKDTFKTPEDYCLATCKGKFQDLAEKLKNEDFDLLITADTIVLDQNGNLLEKPKSHEQHVDFLKRYSDSYLETITATVIGVRTKHKKLVVKELVEKAKVIFDKYDSEFVDIFIKHEKNTR